MKKFDWVYFRKTRSHPHWQWLFDNHNKPLTEQEFIEAMQVLRPLSNSVGKKRQKAYNPSSCRKQYRKLKEDFGFFIN